MGGGGFPVALGEGVFAFWLTPKVQLYSGGRTQVAAGLVNLTIFGAESGSVGAAYVVSTSGRADASCTVGAFVPYRASDSGALDSPLFLIGGERRVGPRLSVVSENYIGRYGATLMTGVRLERGRFSLDLGGAVLTLNMMRRCLV